MWRRVPWGPVDPLRPRFKIFSRKARSIIIFKTFSIYYYFLDFAETSYLFASFLNVCLIIVIVTAIIFVIVITTSSSPILRRVRAQYNSAAILRRLRIVFHCTVIERKTRTIINEF